MNRTDWKLNGVWALVLAGMLAANQNVPYETDPGFKFGDKVRVENNSLVRNP